MIKKDNFRKFDKRENDFEKPKKQVSKISNSEKKSEENIRLNRYIASAGVCSRREADEQIKAGLVSVNGKIVTELGTRVKPTDVVKFNESVLKDQKKIYILMNKPKEVITTALDESGRTTVLDLLKGKVKARIYPVGRLDKNTTGVLLLTNDGDLTKQLTHPKYAKKKIYHVVLDKNLLPSDLAKFAEGIELEDGPMFFDTVSFVSPETKSEVGVEIHSGKNRVVRRMFEALNYRILKLDRVYFAGLTKKNLKRGQWRFLTEKEISVLKMGSYQ
jgi:23S rRNA pseudouridine2605 synthase